MAAFNWLPDFRSNAPSSFTYDLYGRSPLQISLGTRLKQKWLRTNEHIPLPFMMSRKNLQMFDQISRFFRQNILNKISVLQRLSGLQLDS